MSTRSTLPPKSGVPFEGPTSEARTSGFQAHIKGASLSDLIQMECLAGARRGVRVTSAGNTGYLYFRGGQLVHAMARSLTGEPAAIEMLSWVDGTFEPFEREWPVKESISSTWQSLLIRAAQIRDERHGQSVVTLRSDPRPTGQGNPASYIPTVPLAENAELYAAPIHAGGHVFRAEDFAVVLRLTADGTVSLNRGAGQDFADVLAYVCRLTELIGNQLGLEKFVAMECTFKSGRCFVVVESDGDVVALRPHPKSDANAIRELLGI